MAPIIARSMALDSEFNLSGLVLTGAIGVIGILLAYATYKLQRRFHRQRQSPTIELEAQPFVVEPPFELEARSVDAEASAEEQHNQNSSPSLVLTSPSP